MPGFALCRTSASRPSTLAVPTICVVDPVADDYRGWRDTAEAAGARLHIVATPEEALRFARTGTVDLWIINTELPGLSGCELCSMLRGQFPAVTVYLVADQHSAETERAAWAARASMFGGKPAHAEWLDHWLQLRRDRGLLCRVPAASSSTSGRDAAAV